MNLNLRPKEECTFDEIWNSIFVEMCNKTLI